MKSQANKERTEKEFELGGSDLLSCHCTTKNLWAFATIWSYLLGSLDLSSSSKGLGKGLTYWNCLKILTFIQHQSLQAQAWEKHCPLTHLTSYWSRWWISPKPKRDLQQRSKKLRNRSITKVHVKRQGLQKKLLGKFSTRCSKGSLTSWAWCSKGEGIVPKQVGGDTQECNCRSTIPFAS